MTEWCLGWVELCLSLHIIEFGFTWGWDLLEFRLNWGWLGALLDLSLSSVWAEWCLSWVWVELRLSWCQIEVEFAYNWTFEFELHLVWVDCMVFDLSSCVIWVCLTRVKFEVELAVNLSSGCVLIFGVKLELSSLSWLCFTPTAFNWVWVKVEFLI